MIRQSKKIQQVLFFEPISDARVSTCPDDVHRLLRVWKSNPESYASAEPIFNPLMEQFTATRGYGYVHEGLLETQTRDEALHRSCASWRKMLVVQPASRRVDFICSEEELVGHAVYNHCDGVKVSSKVGVRFRQIVKPLNKHLDECPNSPAPEEGERHWNFEGIAHLRTIGSDITGWEVWDELRKEAAKLESD